MNWKPFVFIFILIVLIWFLWRSRSTTVKTVEIKAVPKSKQIEVAPVKKVDPIAPYFTPAKEVVPKDESMMVQTCPFSKPLSTDLPVVDMPRCTVLSERSYRMSEFTSA